MFGDKSTTDVYGLYTENVKNIAETNSRRQVIRGIYHVYGLPNSKLRRYKFS